MTVVSVVKKLLCDMPIPRMVKVRQRFERPKIEDVASELVKKLKDKGVFSAIKPGQSVAIGVGSRGITNLPLMVKTLIDAIKGAGGEPFIVPAMGSHGGATAEGQKGVLERLGVTEEYVGVPIRSSMEVVEIGRTSKGLPVRIDKHALSADHIAIINRIKLHTTFRGKYESGLMKMITIGLGKQAGAEICHELGFEQMAENVVAIAKVALQKMNLLFAVGVIENAYHETAKIAVLEKDEIEKEEPKLLEEAKRLYPKIPFDSLDVLIVDEIGKDISGTGFDTNIVGRYTVPTMTGGPSIKRVVVLDITDKSHGNGNGLGMADFTTVRAFKKFDFEETYPNPLTSTVPLGAKIPMVLESDRLAIQAAVKTSNLLDKAQIKMARIKNTLLLDEMEISENLTSQAEAMKPYVEVASGPYEFPFDDMGNLF